MNDKYFIIIFFLIAFFSIHLNAQPLVLWNKTYDYKLSSRLYSVDIMPDGEYILAGGSTEGIGERTHVYLIVANPSGDTIMTKTICYKPDNTEKVLSIKRTFSDEYILCGNYFYTAGDERCIWISKLNSTCDTLWYKSFNSNGYDSPYSLIETSDSCYIIAGTKELSDNREGWLIKINSNGDSLWTKRYGGNSTDCCQSIIEVENKCYLVAGYTYSYGNGYSDGWIIKINESGDTLWTKTYGTENYESFMDIKMTFDQNYIILGRAEYGRMWLMKVNNHGDSLWSKYYRVGFPYTNIIKSINQVSDNGFIMMGYTLDELMGNPIYGWLLKTDEQGDSIWIEKFDDKNKIAFESIKFLSNDEYVVAGSVNEDALFMKLKNISSAIRDQKIIASHFKLYQNYPNPFNPLTKISYSVPRSSLVILKIYNIFGQEIQTLVNKLQEADDYTINFDAKNLSSGIYFYRLQIGNDYLDTRKMILMR